MATLKKKIKGLNQLLECYLESKKLYAFLADQEKDLQLIRFFNLQSTQRNRFVNDVKGMIRSMGEKPKSSIVKPVLWHNWNLVIDELVSNPQTSFALKAIKKDQQSLQLCKQIINDTSISEEERSLFEVHYKLMTESGEFVTDNLAGKAMMNTMEAIS